ncbi:hypothetical protein NX059_007632 [Plenodomus lindquistii]|nr:hypothetical protein NX059_007632 [Plenodomus lindquistii]
MHNNDLNSGLSPYAYVTPQFLYRGGLTANWQSAPRPWPIFAEYTGGNSANGSLGYSDTGSTMRALLPFSDTRSRSFIHAYEGPAPIVDARTICIRPNITNTWVHINNTDAKIHGNISVPENLLPILLAETPFTGFKPTAFACNTSFNFLRDNIQFEVGDRTTFWDLTVCDLGSAGDGELTSPFWGYIPLDSIPFLLINYTGYADQQVQNSTKFPPLKFANFNDTTPGLHYYNRKEWLDLRQDSQALDWADGNKFSDTRLSFSLCLPVFHAHDFNVSITSQAPLGEPTFFYDAERSQFRYENVRKQLVASSPVSPEERNVLSLHPQSWLLPEDIIAQEDYFGDLSNIISLTSPIASDHPTAHLMDAMIGYPSRADRNIEGLGLEILQEGGTPAEAMQSMLMSVVLADHQSRVFTEVPNGTPNSTATLRSEFITVQVPGGYGRPATQPAGATQSFIIVMIATTIHSVAVFAIFILFIRNTRNTLLWQSWHNVAQSISAVTEPYLSQASLATDSEVEKHMKIDGVSDQVVSIRTHDSGVGAEVGFVRQRLRTKEQKDCQSDFLMEEVRSVRAVSVEE